MSAQPGPERDGEAGIVLVNVLVILTLAASVVYLMISTQDFALEGVRIRSSAAQAEALLRGGELSAVTALRRDMRMAPEADHMGEPWAGAAQAEVALDGGARFALRIEDLQARYDINRLAETNIADRAVFPRIALAAGLSAAQATAAADLVRRKGGVDDLAALAQAGLPPEAIGQLARFVVALDGTGLVNLNTVGAELLAVLISNGPAAERLLRIRERRSELRAEDLTSVGAVRPPLAGWTSQNFRVVVSAEVDGLRRAQESDLLRLPEPAPGRVVVRRRRMTAATEAALPDPGEANRLLAR